ncbi:hypothetical protein Tco_0514985 [Tanacetum coccineum]
MCHKTTLASDTLIDFQIDFSISIGEIVTHWFTLIVLSALRRSDNANVLERFYTSVGNPIKEILLKLNLPDHRILKDGGEVRMTMHEVVHEMVVGECHELNFEGLGSAWKAYMNARVAGLFLLVWLEYPNSKGVVRVTSRGLDTAPYWSAVGAALLISPRQDETNKPLLYVGWMAGPYRVKDAMRGRNDNPMTFSCLVGMVGIGFCI